MTLGVRFSSAQATMKHPPRPEKLYLQGIPEKKVSVIEQAVNSGIAYARQNLRVKKKVDFSVIFIRERGVLSRGRTSKKGITIGVTDRFLRSQSAGRQIAGTAIHEYVHFLRLYSGRHDAQSVLGVIIEEGIAIYMQAMLAGRPNYLARRGPSEATLRMYWSKFSEVIDKPSRKYPQLENNDVYRVVSYRLGFCLVRDFMELHPAMTLPKLVRISGKRLARFAKKVHAPRPI